MRGLLGSLCILCGGVLGMLLYRGYLFIRPQGGQSLWLVPLMFAGVVLLNICCRTLWAGGLHPGGVVLCILLFNTPAETYVTYAIDRIIDTAVGVLMALVISYLFPRGWMQMWPEHYQNIKQHAREAISHVAIHHPPKRKRFTGRH